MAIDEAPPAGAASPATRSQARIRAGTGRRGLGAHLRDAACHGLGRPSFDPFPRLSPDPALRARNLRLPPAGLSYAVLLTPRSGSSRLGAILHRTGALGRPEEVFNPEMMGPLARAWQAGSLEEYVALARRMLGRGGVFGFEATATQVRRSFGSTRRFADLAAPDAWVWLVREDIVLQAVSSARRAQTGIDHHVRTDPRAGADRLAAAEARFRYDGRDIAARVMAMRLLERGGERLLSRLGARPLRLSYERATALDPGALAARVAAHVGVSGPLDGGADLVHRKLGTDKNLDFARRFRAANGGLMRLVDRDRRRLLAALDGPQGW